MGGIVQKTRLCSDIINLDAQIMKTGSGYRGICHCIFSCHFLLSQNTVGEQTMVDVLISETSILSNTFVKVLGFSFNT